MRKFLKGAKVGFTRWLIVCVAGFLCLSCAATMDSDYYGGSKYYSQPHRTAPVPYANLFREAENLMNQAEQLEKTGNASEAANLYYRIATSYPESPVAPEALYRLGRIMGEQGRWHDAVLYHLYLVNNYPQWNKAGEAYYELARAFLMERRVKEAMDAGRKIPYEGRRNFVFGVAVLMDGNVRKAVKYLNASLNSPEMRESRTTTDGIVFLSKVLNETQLGAIIYDKEASGDLKSFVRAGLGRRLIDTGRESEGREILKTTAESLGTGHYLAVAIHNLLGEKMEPSPPPRQQPAPYGGPVNIAAGEPGNPKKIGLMVPLSGSASGYGYQVMRGASLAVTLWNEQHPEDAVELVVQDTLPDAQSAIKAFEKLVNEDKVIAVIGPMSRQGMEAIERSGHPIPLPVFAMVPGDSSGPYQTYGSFIIKFLPDVRTVTDRIVGYSVETLGYRNFALFYPDENFGQQVRDAFIQAVQSRGGQIVAQASYAPGTTNFKSAIENLIGKKEEKASVADKLPFQALFLPDDLKTVSVIAPQLIQANVVGVTLLGSHLWDNPRFSSLSGGYLDGAYYVTPYFIQATDEVASAFKSRFQTMYKTIPQFLEAAGYDATNILLQIRSRADKSRTGLLRVIQQGVVPSGSVTGVKNIDAYGSVNRVYKIITVRGSEPVKIGE